MSEKKHDVCEICGEDLQYVLKSEDVKTLSCHFCEKKFSANTYCPDGHYICDFCHSKDPIKVIKDFCENTEFKDPFLIAENIMKHPKFKMYGPEHHILTPLAILTSLKNNDFKKPSGDNITSSDLKETIKRASKIPGGWCGFYGSCGAGIGSGVAISIFTGATPARDKSRTLANLMTSKSLTKIADNLEHCCKRSVRISIIELINFLKENFDINLEYHPLKCSFSSKNVKCVKEKCFLY